MSAAPGSVSQVLFSPDSRKLYAAVKGFDNVTAPGFLAIWNVSSSGALSKNFKALVVPSGGSSPFSITPVPGSDALLLADSGIGYDIIDLSSSKRSVSVPVAPGNCWSAFSQGTGNYYLAAPGGPVITEISIDRALTTKIVKASSLFHFRSMNLLLFLRNTHLPTAVLPSILLWRMLANRSMWPLIFLGNCVFTKPFSG